MTNPMLKIQHSAEPLVLYGSRARYVTKVGGSVAVSPIDDTEVAIHRTEILKLQGGVTRHLPVAAGDIIEII